MKIVKCSNGHFYDSDSYKSCPHCENNLFSEDMATVHAPTDRLYDDKTFSLYGESEGERTMPADLFGDMGGYDAYSGGSGGYSGSGGPYTSDYASYDRKDNDYYADDEEGTVPVDLDVDMTIPADISPSSLSDQVLNAMNPDIPPAPTKDYMPRHEVSKTPAGPAYSDAPVHAASPVYSSGPAYDERPVYPETQPYPDNSPYSEQPIRPLEIDKEIEKAPADGFGRDYGVSEYSDDAAGGRTKLTISPSLNRPKPSSWPADNGENSIDFEAEREVEEYAASQEFSPMSSAFHTAKFDQSMESADEDKDLVEAEEAAVEEAVEEAEEAAVEEAAVEEEAVEEEAAIEDVAVEEAAVEDAAAEEDVIAEDIKIEADEIFLPEDDEYIPEFDDEVIPFEDDSYDMESTGLEDEGFEDLPDIQLGGASFSGEGEAVSEDLPDIQLEEAAISDEEAAVFEKEAPISTEEAAAYEEEPGFLEEAEEAPEEEPASLEEAEEAPEEEPAFFREAEEESEEEPASLEEAEEAPEEEPVSFEEEAANPFFIPEISFEENTDGQDSEGLVDDLKTIELPVDEDYTVCLKTAGWLVCVEGEEAGRSMVIYDGINTIHPQGEGLSISHARDTSDGKEAAVIYNNESGQFRIQIGFSGLMIYVNDSLVLQPAQLRDRDRISWGSSEYIFVPFCDDNFRWQQ